MRRVKKAPECCEVCPKFSLFLNDVFEWVHDVVKKRYVHNSKTVKLTVLCMRAKVAQNSILLLQGGVSIMTSRIFLKLEEMSADHATTSGIRGFHAPLRALDEMKSRRY